MIPHTEYCREFYHFVKYNLIRIGIFGAESMSEEGMDESRVLLSSFYFVLKVLDVVGIYPVQVQGLGVVVDEDDFDLGAGIGPKERRDVNWMSFAGTVILLGHGIGHQTLIDAPVEADGRTFFMDSVAKEGSGHVAAHREGEMQGQVEGLNLRFDERATGFDGRIRQDVRGQVVVFVVGELREGGDDAGLWVLIVGVGGGVDACEWVRMLREKCVRHEEGGS